MSTEFVRFPASDGVELQGWLSDPGGDTAVVHVHGMSGNGYENYFLDQLQQLYTDLGVAFFPFDNRGRGVVSGFRQGDGDKAGGSCYELFAESAADVQGAVDFVKSRGKTHIVLQGHSLGASKVVNYLVNNPDSSVLSAILLAPTDMVGWAAIDSRHPEYLHRAHQLVAEGTPEELAGPSCWIDKTPLSAQTYLADCEAGTAVDVYGEREGGTLLGRVGVPMVIIYGDKDIGITEIDGSIERYLERTRRAINPHTTIEVITGAPHSFRGYEAALAGRVGSFLYTATGRE